MKELLTYIAKALVDEPDAVTVEEVEKDGQLTLELRVAAGDMGKVIGRGGRVARDLRTVVKAAAPAGVRVNVDILD